MSAVLSKPVFAVIDTNVLVSALLTSNTESKPKQIVEMALKGDIIPLYCAEILTEYEEVLSRDKFPFKSENIADILAAIKRFGIDPGKTPADEYFPDPKDTVFYEVALAKKDSFLITGNAKHFPDRMNVVTPSEFLEVIDR